MGQIDFLSEPLLTVKNPVTGDVLRIPRVLPGPMEGVMRGCLCRAAADLGMIPAWVTPFIRISVDVPRLSKLKRMLEEFLCCDVPVVVQLMGTDAEKLAVAAERLVGLGIAGIDVNFACPSGVVVRHGGGGGMLRRPAEMVEIMCRLREVCGGIALSAKIRSGFESASEMEEIIPMLCGSGIDFLSLHYRTVRELYKPAANRNERLRRAVALAGSVPLIGSGDVYSLDDVQEICGECGCAGVMAARGWLRDPGLLRRIEAAAGGVEVARDDVDPRWSLLRRMAELARDNPVKYGTKTAFLEAAVFMFGGKSRVFREMVSAEEEAFLSYLTGTVPDDGLDVSVE